MVRNLIDVIALKCKNDLFKIAMADSGLSQDEEQLLNTTIQNLQELRNYVRNIFSDGKIDQVEKDNISFFVDKIGKDSIIIAFHDKILTRDEKLLLQIIKKTVIELKKIVAEIKVDILDSSLNL